MKKEISEGFEIPKHYGIAWVNFQRNTAICYPIPLHIIVWIARKLWFWMKMDWGWRTGYDTGFQQGSKDGAEQAKKMSRYLAKRELEKIIKDFLKAESNAIMADDNTGWIIKFIEKKSSELSTPQGKTK